jgi:hypothetical protein
VRRGELDAPYAHVDARGVDTEPQVDPRVRVDAVRYQEQSGLVDAIA